ncbi:MAG: hypothetical protein K6T81_05025 [Alicyclobacillus macrosporangiidus]|uniref:hypothetical protein n=1 Tax=Alicyclobacillus macrosporangiidus TaxID=392015 RepID=UPI0026F23381|nr:hypothetical protein [Alicyclobacillus macrosporangiidus]MCL6598084.1 hypothetical protein [Alicyclobacillus macrosporangiidus]
MERKRRKTGRRILAFVAVVTAVQVGTFYHYNAILAGAQPSAENRTAQAPSRPNDTAKQQLAKLKQLHPTLAVSDDGRYAAYADDGHQVHVVELGKPNEVASVQMKAPVVYLKWVQDSALFVGEKFDAGSDHRLALATIDVSTQTVRLIQTFSHLYATTTFKDIEFSDTTNDIYVLIGNSQSDQVYHFNIMSEMSEVPLGGRRIDRIAVSATTNDLYVQDFAEGTHNVLVYNKYGLTLIRRNAALLRAVDNDLYYAALNDSGEATAVYRYSPPTTSARTGNATAGTSSGTGTSSLVKTLDAPVDPAALQVSDDGAISVQPANPS